MSCACFYCMASKWGGGWGEGRGGGGGGGGREMASVYLACDGDICLKIRIKPLKIYLGVELNRQPHQSYSDFYCTIECCLQFARNFGNEEKPGPSLLSQGRLPGTGKKMWPIADRRVPSDEPRSNCGTHFGSSSQFPSRR